MSTLAPDVRLSQRNITEPLPVAVSFLFGVTILFSACLLFLIQPLASKLILPWFGGSAAVWITCMLFFQAGLLLGYLYAHELSRRFAPRVQAGVHVSLLLVSLIALHVLPNPAWQPRPGEDPTWRLFGVLATSVGLPYVLLSSTSPLLQSWFSRTGNGALPYRYFALSNAGSLAALASYPVLIEPHLTGTQQATFWSWAFIAFVLVCAVTARSVAVENKASVSSLATLVTPGSKNASPALWLGLSACTSALLLTVTNLLTQNIAPMPLVWVLPLSVYLLTFIFCFESERWYRSKLFLPLVLPAIACFIAIEGPLGNDSISVELPMLLVSLFVCCMACHGELAALRPPPSRLTGFYLCISGGGVLGALFVALLAPHLFPATYENPVVFISCPALLLFVLWTRHSSWWRPSLLFAVWLTALSATVLLSVYVLHYFWDDYRSSVLLARNFYGALRVEDSLNRGRKIRELNHGTITHGLQFLAPNLRHQATTYYGRSSGIGLTWRVLQESGSLRTGIIGLGAGTLAAYGRAGDNLRFYEINPLIESIARSRFTFLSDCPAHLDVVLGDARLTMSAESEPAFDILVIDAFSGDAIPVHLLTREAFALYWRHLKPDGVLAVHVSNRYLDLAPVVKLAAQRLGKPAWRVDNEDNDLSEIYGASYVLMTDRQDLSMSPLFRNKLLPIQIPGQLREWTDDYSNLWHILSSSPH